MTDQQEPQNQGQATNSAQTWSEEIETSGENLLAKVRELLHEGNVTRVILKNEDGNVLFEIPMTAGVAVTVLTAAVSPVLVAIGAVAALVSRVTIVVERRSDGDTAESE